VRYTSAVCVGLGVLLGAGAASNVPADRIPWHVVAAGGTVGSTAGAHRVSASVGQTVVAALSGTTYRVFSGFWNPLLIGPVGAEDEPYLGIPRTFGLSQNHPNPFESGTTIRYALPRGSHVVLEVYDVGGRRVRLLAEGDKGPGYHVTRWDGRDACGSRVGSGVYLCHMRARATGGITFERSTAMLLAR
jgi:hypothetical protein